MKRNEIIAVALVLASTIGTVLGVAAVPHLRADKLRLAQAFSPLASNAIKFTPDGGRIDIGARLLAPEGAGSARVEVVFVDSGIGLASEHHERVFEKFFRVGQVDQHTTSNTRFMGGGPGLGLAIAKGVIEAHGGRIWVESTGHDAASLPGSRFHVVLPLLPPSHPGTEPSGPAHPATPAPGAAPPKKVNPFVGLE